MKKLLALVATALLQASALAATYTYSGPTYFHGQLSNFTACPGGSGNCGAFTVAMSHTGSFTTAAPLPNNLNGQDISALITGFSFSDGLTTYASGDPQVTLSSVSATNNGGPLQIDLQLDRWQTPAPHVAGSHNDQLILGVSGWHNVECAVVTPTPQGAICQSGNGGVFSSGYGTFLGNWNGPVQAVATGVTSVPTLSEWGLLLLAGLMGMGGAWSFRNGNARSRWSVR